jgi:hypothetical protein
MKFDAVSGDSSCQIVTKICDWVKRIYVLNAKELVQRTAVRTLNKTERISAMHTVTQNCKQNEQFYIPPTPNFIQIGLAVTTL